jgi:hypothetical protein
MLAVVIATPMAVTAGSFFASKFNPLVGFVLSLIAWAIMAYIAVRESGKKCGPP